MSLPQIIGLNGVARAGKDTVAGILHDLYGYTPISFSDILNRALVALNPIVDTSGTRYANYVETLGYEEAKEIPEVRRLLQAMGTEVGRNLLGTDIWVEALFKNLPEGKVAITNVRFPNEANSVWGRGGVVWRVTRPGFEPSNGHISDTALDDYKMDAYIANNGTVRELADEVMGILHPGAALNKAFNRGRSE